MELGCLGIYFNISKALKTVGFPFSEPFSVRNKTCGQGLWTMDWHNSPCALITTTPTAAEMSCKNHFSFIKKNYACYMLSNYTLSGLEITRKKKHVVKSRPPCNFKTGHFKSFIGRGRPRNVLNGNMHVQNVQNCSFSSFNMQICDVLVSLALVT